MGGIEGHYEELFLCASRAAQRVLPEREAAADVASEAVARALVRWPRIEAYAPAWVTRVAVNLAVDELRRRQRRPAGEARSEGEPSLDRVALAAALARLPRRQRETLVVRFLLDLDEKETARLLGVSVATVHAHASRGLKQMRGLLPPDDSFGGELT